MFKVDEIFKAFIKKREAFFAVPNPDGPIVVAIHASDIVGWQRIVFTGGLNTVCYAVL
jgi:hypothetical protein